MDLTQSTGVLAKFLPVCEYSVCGSVGHGSRRHESETKQNLLCVLLLREYITFEIILIDKGIFIRQLFMHIGPYSFIILFYL